MTSLKQIEANRRNSLKSTGPKTETGKQASCRNAVRHGLTAETVICALKDAKDYKAFEAAVTADYDAQSAVERELVLRLASLLWRLRRATTTASREIVYALFNTSSDRQTGSPGLANLAEMKQAPGPASTQSQTAPDVELARCFLRLSNLPNYVLDRLSRYEVILWRQAGQILFALDNLDRRKPKERVRRFGLGSGQHGQASGAKSIGG